MPVLAGAHFTFSGTAHFATRAFRFGSSVSQLDFALVFSSDTNFRAASRTSWSPWVVSVERSSSMYSLPKHWYAAQPIEIATKLLLSIDRGDIFCFGNAVSVARVTWDASHYNCSRSPPQSDKPHVATHEIVAPLNKTIEQREGDQYQANQQEFAEKIVAYLLPPEEKLLPHQDEDVANCDDAYCLEPQTETQEIPHNEQQTPPKEGIKPVIENKEPVVIAGARGIDERHHSVDPPDSQRHGRH